MKTSFSLSLLGLLAALTAAPAIDAGPAFPATPKRPVTDVYHGVRLVDEYQWLEDWSDPEVRAWSDSQNAAARAMLDALPHVVAIRARVTEIMQAPTFSHGSLHFAGGHLFAMKRQPPKQQPYLVIMDAADRPESARTLVDPNTLSQDGTVAIDWYVPSPDGRLVAVSLSEGGSESGDLHLYEVASGRELGEVIPRVQGGTGGGAVAWEPDAKAFFYTRYPRGDERPVEDRDFYMQVYRHVLGTPTATDTYEIGREFPKIAEVVVETSPEGLALVTMQKGDGGEFEHHLRTLDGRWHQLTRYEDRIVQAVLGRSVDGEATPVYLVSLQDAPRGKLLRLSAGTRDGAGAELRRATVLIPEQKDTLAHEFGLGTGNILAAASRLYLTYQLGGPSEIRVFDLTGRPLPAPQQFAVGSAGGLVGTGREDSVLFSATSYIDAPAWFQYDAVSGATTRLPLIQSAPVDFSDCEVVREWATSKDGTQVPVNIIRKKGLKLDGSHPCLITGYGGYGVNQEPSFSARRRVLIEQGVVWAEANIRGGGEFGDAWHRQGNLTRKQNVFDDFAAACRHMIEAGYTSSARLAIEGGSNGGLLMGAMLTQHPDLARCVVSHVGIYDMLRVELSPNGTFNIPEFGTVKDRDQFAAMHAYSPYHHVVEGTRYPVVLFLTGANDPRVDPMHSRKMTARLQAAGATCLLRTSANSGHGIGTALSARIEETVDVDAFLFSQLGVDYRPVASGR
ncbi:MAG: S9 family peptidase [Opitutaceae bacterium]|nr:S9 family peptidase [Opitutaceae bacterium]